MEYNQGMSEGVPFYGDTYSHFWGSAGSPYSDHDPPVRYLSPEQWAGVRAQEQGAEKFRIACNEKNRREHVKAIMEARRRRFRMLMNEVARESLKRDKISSSANHPEILTKAELQAILRNQRKQKV